MPKTVRPTFLLLLVISLGISVFTGCREQDDPLIPSNHLIINSPQDGSVVPPGYLEVSWSTSLTDSVALEITNQTPGFLAYGMDTVQTDTSWTTDSVLLPGCNYILTLTQGGLTATSNFSVGSLQSLFLDSLQGTWNYTYYNDASGYSYSSDTGAISISGDANDATVSYGQANVSIPFQELSGSIIRFYMSFDGYTDQLDVDLSTKEVYYYSYDRYGVGSFRISEFHGQ